MLDRISLSNFRCFTERTIELAPQTALIGANGAGKTSVLEAISLLSVTTSWRTSHDKEVVRFDAPFCRVRSEMSELVIQREPYLKRIKVDGVSKRTREVLGILPSVLFQPDDLQLLTGSPSLRRHYLDRLLCQISPGYTVALAGLNAVLKQRNKLLRQIQDGIANKEQLGFWNEQLIGAMLVIQPQRAEYLQVVGEQISELFERLVPSEWKVSAVYVQSPGSAEMTTEALREHLQANFYKEVAAGVSLYGPQRDDFVLTWNNHPVSQVMSRGQLRSLALALKVLEVQMLERRLEIPPILLLDDILSELDNERQRLLFEVVGECQMVLSATDLPEGIPGRVVSIQI